MQDKFSERLSEALKIKNVSQSELVRRTGIGKSTISQYLSGLYKAKQENITKIAIALNVSEIWLMGLSDDMNRENPSTPFGSEQEIHNYFIEQGREDLWNTFVAVNSNDTLRILMDGAADLTPEDLEPVLILVQGIRKSKGLE